VANALWSVGACVPLRVVGFALRFGAVAPAPAPAPLRRRRQEAYVPTHHVNSPQFKGQAGEKVSAWDPSAAPVGGRGIRPRTPATAAADHKDILDLK